MDNSFKWLHLSDFHIGKDNYGQIKLFKYLHEHMSQNKKKGFFPDAVFITGDIANKGQADEYDMFLKEFIEPLSEIYESVPRIYCNAALCSRRKKHFIFDSINTITAPSFR